MKTPKFLAVSTGLLASLVIAAPAWAGAELKIDDESSINLGFRAQVLAKFADQGSSTSGFDNDTDFQVRRARIRLLGKINKHISAFLQTELGGTDGGGGQDVRYIDAFVKVNYNPWAQIIAGINMAPASRQSTTGSGGLMTMDRPGNNYKNLTWGGRALRNFSTTTITGTTAGLSAPVAVRDTGVTLFGSGSLSDTSHLKYYLGVYDGIQAASNDNLRMTARAQWNLGDAEAGYYNTSTYLGKKKTLAFGVSYDVQDQVLPGSGSGSFADYAVLQRRRVRRLADGRRHADGRGRVLQSRPRRRSTQCRRRRLLRAGRLLPEPVAAVDRLRDLGFGRYRSALGRAVTMPTVSASRISSRATTPT